MVRESQIVDALRTIDQYRFERLIAYLLNQGAFPEIAWRNAIVEPFGTNIYKQRTIKSAPHTDLEIPASGTRIEVSAQASWSRKFKTAIEGNRTKEIKTFVFFTSQDTGTKMIRIHSKRNAVDAKEWAKEQLGCEDCLILGSKELVHPLSNPDFFSVRRTWLAIDDDFFQNPQQFLAKIGSYPHYDPGASERELEQHSFEIERDLDPVPGQVTLLHNDNYFVLLHSLGAWAKRQTYSGDSSTFGEFCFINSPASNRSLRGTESEINGGAETTVVVWNADEIENLQEYLKFCTKSSSLLMVTKTLFKDRVLGRLESSGAAGIAIREVSIGSIDSRIPTAAEVRKHDDTIRRIAETTADLLSQLEALIYFYSPVYLSDTAKRDRLARVLDIDVGQLAQLVGILERNGLAGVTGDIIWLSQPAVARQVLSRLISEEVLPIERLV